MRLVKPEDQIANLIAFGTGVIFALSGPWLEIRLFAGVLTCISILMATNALNQYAEVDLDRLNKPHRPLVSGAMTKNGALSIVIGFYILAVIGSLVVGGAFQYLALASISLGILYSAKPVILKKRFLLSNASIAIYYGALNFLLGWSIFQPLSVAPWHIVIFLTLFDFFANISKDYGDMVGDGSNDIRTLPVVLGRATAIKFQFSGLFSMFLFIGMLGTISFYFPFILAPLGVGVSALSYRWIRRGNDSMGYGGMIMLYMAVRLSLVMSLVGFLGY